MINETHQNAIALAAAINAEFGNGKTTRFWQTRLDALMQRFPDIGHELRAEAAVLAGILVADPATAASLKRKPKRRRQGAG